MFCEKCGNQLRDEAKFCQKCGAAVVNSDSEDSMEKSDPEPIERCEERRSKSCNTRKRLLIIGVSVTLFVSALTVCVVFFFFNRHESAPEQSNQKHEDGLKNLPTTVKEYSDEIDQEYSDGSFTESERIFESETTQLVEETTVPPTADSFIKIYKEGDSFKVDGKNEHYIMPLFNIDSDDAEAMNEELIASYDDCLPEILSPEYSGIIYSVNYEVYLNDTILSLCVEQKAGGTTYRLAYNIDVTTGQQVHNDGIAEHFGTTAEALHDAIRNTVDSEYRASFSYNVENNTKYYQKTMSEENIGAVRLFIGDNNELKMMYTAYWGVMIGKGQFIASLKY